MSPDTKGEIDGKPARLGDVPKGRLHEWVTTVDGGRTRPFRFVDTSALSLVPQAVTR